MQRTHSNLELIHFLQHDLALSTSEIGMLLRRQETEQAPIPMLLWQYGLISLEQLGQVFDWLESRVQLVIESSV
jgi:hypothetical protein